jgi:hypothetical protein
MASSGHSFRAGCIVEGMANAIFLQCKRSLKYCFYQNGAKGIEGEDELQSTRRWISVVSLAFVCVNANLLSGRRHSGKEPLRLNAAHGGI